MPEPEFNKSANDPFAALDFREVPVQTDGENPQHLGVINAWGGAILRNEPLVADGREGIYGLTLSNAMHLSSWLEKTVDIPFDENLYFKELSKRVENSRPKKCVKAVVAGTKNSYQGTGEHKKRWDTNW